jgi:nicotinate-nucleotide adenylyltransferase
VPPHRNGRLLASGYQRFALVALAIQDHPGFRAAAMELERGGHSFTVETLRQLHAEGYRPLQLFFIIGADAFAEIATWREYPGVLDAAHFVVIARPGASLATAIARNPSLAPRLREPRDDRSETGIFLVEAHTRDVSSTSIRSRLAAGQTIEDLVPAPVARYIAANDLYRTVNQLHG